MIVDGLSVFSDAYTTLESPLVLSLEAIFLSWSSVVFLKRLACRSSMAWIAIALACALECSVSSFNFRIVSYYPRQMVPLSLLRRPTINMSPTYILTQLLLTLELKGFISISIIWRASWDVLSPSNSSFSRIKLMMSVSVRPRSRRRPSIMTVLDCAIFLSLASSSSN